MNLHTQLIREQACAEDMNKEIQMHIQEGQYDLAERRTADLMRSIKNMQQLQQRINDWKNLNEVTQSLASRGLIGEVVSRFEEVAR